jgi:hypothetical protein
MAKKVSFTRKPPKPAKGAKKTKADPLAFNFGANTAKGRRGRGGKGGGS